MSGELTINASAVKMFDSSMQIHDKKDGNSAVLNDTKENGNPVACTLNISKEAMLKFRNRTAEGETESREEVRRKRKLLTLEDIYISDTINKHVLDDPCWQEDHTKMMRLDEPETYAEYKELCDKAAQVAIQK